MSAIALTVGCALAWASLDAIRKVLAARISPAALTILLTLGLVPVFGIPWLLEGHALPPGSYLLPGSVAAVGQILASLAMLQALRISDLGITIPMLSLTPVFSALVAWLVLDEQLSGMQLLGLVLVVLSAFVLQLRITPGKRWSFDQGAALMVLAALLWSLVSVFGKVAMEVVSLSAHAFFQALAGVLVLGGIEAVRGSAWAPLHQARGMLGWLAVATVILVLAITLQLLALPLVAVGLLEGIKRAVGLTAAVLNGWLFFGEAITLRRIACICAMGLGGFLLLGS